MKFGRFFKKKKLCPIHDENFLKIEWDKEFSPSNAEVQAIIEKIDQDEVTKDWAQLSESLPYITFAQAEAMFLRFKETFVNTGKINQIIIKKVVVAHREDEEEPTTDGEVFSEPFIIDGNYQNLLKPLVESILGNKSFSGYSYDQKRTYFMDAIYPSYLNSVKATEEVLPVFPSQFEVENGNFEVVIPAFSKENQVKTEVQNESVVPPVVIKKETQSLSDEFVLDKQSDQTPIPTSNSTLDNLLNDSETVIDSVDTSYFDSSDYNEDNDNVPIFEEPLSKRQTVTDEYVVDPKVAPLPASVEGKYLVSFPKFERITFEKQYYEPYETEYVPWKLNQLKEELNSQITNQETTNNVLIHQAITHKLYDYEKELLRKVQSEVEKQDKRDSLKDTILTETASQRETEWLSVKRHFEAEKEEAVALEKQRYEDALRKIQKDFEQNIEKNEIMIKSKYLKQAQSNYQAAYYDQTGKLQELLDEQMQRVTQLKQQKQVELDNHFSKLALEVGNKLFEQSKTILDTQELKFLREHDYAKRVNLVQKEEEMRRQQDLKVVKYMEELRTQVDFLLNEKEELSNQQAQMQQRLHEEQKKSLDEKEQFLARWENIQTEKKALAS